MPWIASELPPELPLSFTHAGLPRKLVLQKRGPNGIGLLASCLVHRHYRSMGCHALPMRIRHSAGGRGVNPAQFHGDSARPAQYLFWFSGQAPGDCARGKLRLAGRSMRRRSGGGVGRQHRRASTQKKNGRGHGGTPGSKARPGTNEASANGTTPWPIVVARVQVSSLAAHGKPGNKQFKL